MKIVNFVDTFSPQEQKAMRQWFWISCTCFFLVIIALFTTSIKECTKIKHLQKKQKRSAQSSQRLQAILNEKRGIKERIEMLNEQITKLTRIKEQPKNPAALLQLLQSLKPNALIINNIDLRKNSIALTIMAPQAELVLEYVKSLSNTETFSSMEIETLTPMNETIQATVTGTIN